jgi:hypothetical protein
MRNLISSGILGLCFVMSMLFSASSSAYMDIGCTADTTSSSDEFIFNCYINIDDPVWHTDVDGLRVTHQGSGYWQQCWDDTTNQYATTGLLTQDDLTYPEWVESSIVHYIEIKVFADKKYGPDPTILLHYTPDITSQGNFYFHSIANNNWTSYVPSPDTRHHSFDWEPTPCD